MRPFPLTYTFRFWFAALAAAFAGLMLLVALFGKGAHPREHSYGAAVGPPKAAPAPAVAAPPRPVPETP